jgi:ATP-dependent RNA helicase RhlE
MCASAAPLSSAHAHLANPDPSPEPVQPPADSTGPMFEQDATFSALGLSDAASAHLPAHGLHVPTRVQAAVIPVLLNGLCVQLEYGDRVHAAQAMHDEEVLAAEAAAAAAATAVISAADSAAHAASIGMASTSAAVDDDTYDDFDNFGTTSTSSALYGSSSVDSYGAKVQASTVPAAAEFKRPPPPTDDKDDVVMLGAETGSGKTLAYLLPYIEAVRRNPASPVKAIIMVPSRELCTQVSRQLKTYFPDAPATLVLAGGLPPDVDDIKGVRVVIATPAALLTYFRFSPKIDANDKYIVVDEADMLLTGSFLRQVEEVLDQPGMKPFATRKNGPDRAVNRNRLVFVGATYPHWTGERVKSIVTWMNKRYPSIRTVQTDDIHKRSLSIADTWHYLPNDDDRLPLLRDILKACSLTDKVMVFGNQAGLIQQLFDEMNIQLGDAINERFGALVQLHKNVSAHERESSLGKFRAGEARLLLCTDLAARGLDLGNVTRVIEYDFSTNVVGYLHRIGRTARAGASGATNHFYNDQTRALAEAIKERSSGEMPVVEGVFSRDRSFRRKNRKREMEAEMTN